MCFLIHLLHTRRGGPRPTSMAAEIHPRLREKLGVGRIRPPVPETRVNPKTSFGSSREDLHC